MSILAFDTSNYSTSIAYYNSDTDYRNASRLLDVASGSLGLRQQEALFQHTKALPILLEAAIKEVVDFPSITAIGVSTRPREVEGSYMPCFLAGENLARSLGTVLGIPVHCFSHQQGHLVAVAWACKAESILDKPFLAWHLSGGTTELLQVHPAPHRLVRGEIIGGTTDISAGQLIDRTGQKLGLDFPAGKAVDALALESKGSLKPFPLKIQDFSCSLSGMENKVAQFVAEGESPAEICGFVLETLALFLEKVTAKAQEETGVFPVLYCGGVSSSQYLKRRLVEGIFSPDPSCATDNAMGIAILAKRLLRL